MCTVDSQCQSRKCIKVFNKNQYGYCEPAKSCKDNSECNADQMCDDGSCKKRLLAVDDGEFDNVDMLEWIKGNTNWSYVQRTCKSYKIVLWGKQQRIENMAKKVWQIYQKETLFTGKEFGPVTAMAWWEKEYKEPIYLLTNLEDIDRACEEYSKRSLIETLFSDQKSRGFGIDKSRLSDPKKVERLFLASCMAYIWMIWLEVEVLETGNLGWNDHANRQDKSIFRLGLDWLKHLLKRGKRLVVSFNTQMLSSV